MWWLSYTENFTLHHLLYCLKSCRSNLPQKFGVATCRENLPWLFAVGICRSYFPWEFAAAICCGNLLQLIAVTICHGFVLCMQANLFEQIFFLCNQIFFIWKQTFFICEQNFLFIRISLLTVFLFVFAVAVMCHRTYLAKKNYHCNITVEWSDAWCLHRRNFQIFDQASYYWFISQNVETH